MPAELRKPPALDDGLAVWMPWWEARDAWRKAHALGPASGGWISDVASWHAEWRRRWAAAESSPGADG